MESVNVYNNGYEGPSYSVKYLGIVDGTMGILSRKMAMPTAIPQNSTYIKEATVKIDTKKLQPKVDLFAPVLKGKSYAQKLGGVGHMIPNNLSQDLDNSAIIYTQKINTMNRFESNDDQTTLVNNLSQNNTLGNQTGNHQSKVMDVINVKFTKDNNSGYDQNSAYNENLNFGEGRKSADKTSIESPNRNYMQSLMDHSHQPTPKKKNDYIISNNSNSKTQLKTNLKLTGKTIIEGGNNQNLSSAIRVASREGITPPRNQLYQLDYRQNQDNSQISQMRSQHNTTYSHNQKPIQEQDYLTAVQQNLHSNERVSGYPKPELYNQHYINKYSFPKGLIACKKPEEIKNAKQQRVSLYDMDTPLIRKGISGWKLTKRPMGMPLDNSFQLQNPNYPPLLENHNTHNIKGDKKRRGKMNSGMSVHNKNGMMGSFVQEEINEENEDAYQGRNANASNVRRSVNQDNQLTNIKISYHNQQANDQLSGEAQPHHDDHSYQISPRTGGDQELITNSYSNRKLQNQYNL